MCESAAVPVAHEDRFSSMIDHEHRNKVYHDERYGSLGRIGFLLYLVLFTLSFPDVIGLG